MRYKLKYGENLTKGREQGKDYLDKILIARGVKNPEKYRHYDPKEPLIQITDPTLLDNIDKGAEMLINHLANGQVYLLVDCDVDGLTSAAIIYNYIHAWTIPANPIYIGHHSGKQHGVKVDNVPEGTTLVLTPDAGSNQYEEHQQLKKMGIDVLVIDHHHAEKYSEDACVINNQLSGRFPSKGLSGAGVVYKFCQYLDSILGLKKANDFIDLAALGCVADMMDLRDEEVQYIVSRGLKRIKNEGFKAVIDKQSFVLKNRTQLFPVDVSFYIAPLINAITRVGTIEEKELMFLAFTQGTKELQSKKRGAASDEIETAADMFARVAVNARSRQNREIENAMDLLIGRINEFDLDNDKLMVLYTKDEDKVNRDITGLVAMKLTKLYDKPVLLLKESDDEVYKGSGRGLNDSELKDFRAFCDNSGFFELAQGHAGAFGAWIPKSKVHPFLSYANQELSDIDFGQNTYFVDYVFEKNEITELANLILDIDTGEFFGQGVEEPRVIAKEIVVKQEDIFFMKNNSLKFSYKGIDFAVFGNAEIYEAFAKEPLLALNIYGIPKANHYKGTITPQLTIKDYEFLNFKALF